MPGKSLQQLSLFQPEQESTFEVWKQQASEWGYRLVFDELDTEKVTFLGGLDERVHSWFRLTPSFSPYLVRLMLERLGTESRYLILDPFAGASTTLIESKFLGYNAIGVEINPVFVLMGECALDWDYNIPVLRKVADELLRAIKAEKDACRGLSLEEYLYYSQMKIPPIQDPFRWWRRDVLKDLLTIKRQIKSIFAETHYFKLFWGALCSIVIDVANVHRRHPTLTFTDRSNDCIDVIGEFKAKVERMVRDLTGCATLSKVGTAIIKQGDSTKLSSIAGVAHVDRVITSPPYPNRYSYVMETRPQLFFLDMMTHAKEAADLDLATIGGTWGKATSVLQNGAIQPIHPVIAESLKEQIAALRTHDNLMCNYAVKFFNMMYVHFTELVKVLNKGARCAYVVGNSRLKGQDFFTDLILANMMQTLNFTVDEIWVVRRRLGRRELYEDVVIATWNG